MVAGNSSTGTVASVGMGLVTIAVLGLATGSATAVAGERLEVARTLATVAGALAVVVLAGLTGWYASRTDRYVAEAQSLRRRPYVKRIVATGLDPLLAWLADCRAAWAVDDPPAGMPIYPDLEDVEVPEAVVADLAGEHPDLVADVEAVLADAREYRREWERLHADLTHLIESRLSLADPPEAVAAVIPGEYARRETGEGVDPSMAPEAFVRAHAATFARLVLTNPEPEVPASGPIGADAYAELVFAADRREFVTLRGADAVADQVELVHRRWEELAADGADVEDRLRDVREEYVAEYDLMETELGAVGEGGRAAI